MGISAKLTFLVGVELCTMTTNRNAISVFLSYAHEDEPLLRQLETHLSLLKRQGLISTWYDRQIVPGSNWAKVIDERLEQASIILLLVSPDFLASDYCYQDEMKRALERHDLNQARVIPIVLRPVDWEGAPFAHLQVLPSNAKPVTRWKNRDDALLDVGRGIRVAIEEFRASSLGTSSWDVKQMSAKKEPLRLWKVPYRRNPFFTGREDALAVLHDRLHRGGAAALTQAQAISGLGGIGKTQTALEYAYRYRDDYQVVLWVKADTVEALTSDFMVIANLLNVAEQGASDLNQVMSAVRYWLEQNTHWLLIMDNVESMDLVYDFLPKGNMGHVLLTTRAQAVGTIANSIELKKMGKTESSLLLLRRAKLLALNNLLNQAGEEDQSQAEAINTDLDGLPLALDQAGAYIEETRCSLSEYLDIYRTRRRELLQRRGRFSTDHPDSVASTLSLSIQKVEQINPAAADLLRLCAYLDPDAIPEEILTEGASDLGPLLGPVAADALLLNEAMQLLLQFSLLKRNPTMKTLTIHRLVQAILLESMDEHAQRVWAERTVHAVNHIFPYIGGFGEPLDLRYLPHAQLSTKLIVQWEMRFLEAGQLLAKMGWYLREVGLGDSQTEEEAELPLLQALEIHEQLLGPEHLDVARSLDSLAFLYRNQGKYDEAEQLHQRAFVIKEKLLGPEDKSIANSCNNLALIYSSQGKYSEAEQLYQRALAILEQKPESEVSYALPMCLHNLAWVYQNQEKYAQAELLHQRALTFREKILGPEDLEVAWSLDQLATFYENQGKYAEAEQLYQRALMIYKSELGPKHREVGHILSRLANIYSYQSRFEQAELLYQEALTIAENLPSPRPRDIADVQLALALNSSNQGNYEQAESHLEQAVVVYINVWGLERTATHLERVASELQKLKREAGVPMIEERTKSIRDKILS
jgi:tetratricopeptide (TPR) repeat protein